jgi:hypothetical protein
MKRCLILLALIVGACTTSSFDPAKKAARLVWRHYSDCREIIMIDVDTITLGDNLQYRIEQQKKNIEYAKSNVNMYRRRIREFWSSSVIASGYRKDLHRADSVLNKEKLRLADLDSLKQATLDIANTPAAYLVCVAYNSPMNLVWVQLDEYGTLLAISKRREDLYLNPGRDMPGYFEITQKHAKR